MTQTFRVGARSRFVTAAAWLAIAAAPAGPAAAIVPWLQAHPPAVAAAALGLAMATLVVGAGLLLRLEWARRGCIVLLVLAAVAGLGGLWLQQALIGALVDAALARAPLPTALAGVFDGFVVAARSLAGLLTVAGCAALGWAAWRLTQPAIRQEFA